MKKLFCLVIISVVGCGDATSKPQHQSETWTHQDVLKHLEAKELPLLSFPTKIDAKNGPAVIAYPERKDDPKLNNPARINDLYKAGAYSIHFIIYIQKRPTAADARDAAGAQGKNGYAWGRFYFHGDTNMIELVEERLP